MADIPVIIVIDDAADFNKVKNACASRGLSKISELPRMRMIKGFIEPSGLFQHITSLMK